MNPNEPAMVVNPDGRAPMLLVCDHASNAIPQDYRQLGLSDAMLADHVGWDIGARAMAVELARLVDAPLVCAPASRLLVDPNRALDAHDLIPVMAEGEIIPGNMALPRAERDARIAAFHAPYHAAIDAILTARSDIGQLVSIHSFTPSLGGKDRPWHVGVLYADDARLADRLIDALFQVPGLVVGRNQPYAPADGVYYTLDRHGGGRETAMIEVRNDQLRDEAGQRRWAALLAGMLDVRSGSTESETTGRQFQGQP